MRYYKQKACFITGLFLISFMAMLGQNQDLADSLKARYIRGSLNQNELDQIQLITENENNLEERMFYCNLLLEKAEEISSTKFLRVGYLNKGNTFQLMGDYEEALAAFFKSMEYAKTFNDNALTGGLYISIADTYSMMDNSENAEEYYNQGISLLRASTDSATLATALLNAGDEYSNSRQYSKALNYFKESGEIFDILDYNMGKAYNLGNIGMVYAEQGKDQQAIENINEAVGILEELQAYYPISVYLTYMADIYASHNNFSKAFDFANRSLELATKYGLKDQISDAHLKLSELYEQSGDQKLALSHFKDYLVYRDSVKNLETIQKMADQRTDFELSKKQVEIDLLEQKGKTQRAVNLASGVATIAVIVIAFGLYRRNRFIQKTKNIIAKEKERSDSLLLNILPAKTAEELKLNGKVKSHRFDSVSVLFTDFVGFTAYSKNLSPEELVETVDFYFSKFDEIIERNNLEKIKTIGDAYMCAGGLPFEDPQHAINIVNAALEIIEYVNLRYNDKKSSESFEIRVGINSGPVVAGIVGSKKFAYDIWGDTVNIASRMESNSEKGKINISENTYELVKDYFYCEYRGEIKAKNRGKLKMYYVKGIKKTISHSKLKQVGESPVESAIENFPD